MADRPSIGWELGVTVGAPTAVLWGLTERLGAAPALALALAFPVAWISWGIWRTRQIDRLAALALFGIAVTGGVGLLQLDARWVALKEFLVPGLFASLFLGSAATGGAAIAPVLAPLFDADALRAALAARGAEAAWSRAQRVASAQLGAILLASGVANGALAWWILDAPPGTEAFNADLSRLNTAGLIAVTLPTIGASLWPFQRLFQTLERLTGVPVDALMAEKPAGSSG